MIPSSVNELLMAGDDIAGYEIANSLMLDSSLGQYLSRTFTSSAVWTLSIWVKRGKLTSISPVLENALKFNADDTITAMGLTTTAVFRDPSSYYHIVVSNSGLYVNNARLGNVTTSALTNPRIGYNGANLGDGYNADVCLVEGQALAPASFGKINPETGQWVPIAHTGSYGTNGFKLEFKSPAALGADTSGNGNNWTLNGGIVAANQTVDTPTNNFAVLNALYTGKSTLSKGNLTASGTTDLPTIIPNSGTWYFEIAGVSKAWTLPAVFPSAAGEYNFGAKPFSNTATAPTLCTKNLPEPLIKNPASAFVAVTVLGSSIESSLASAAPFTDYLEISKDRSSSQSWKWRDTVRGVANMLSSDLVAGEAAYTAPTAGDSYVGYRLRKSAACGIDIILDNGTGVAHAINHSLGIKPAVMIRKSRGATAQEWPVYHQILGATKYLYLGESNGAGTDSTFWNNTEPTSSQFTVGTIGHANTNGVAYVTYLFAEVPGFSKFGSFVANSSADNYFVHLGFKAAFFRFKRIDSAGDWITIDNLRVGYNPSNEYLLTNSAGAEGATDYADIVSNGVKIRNAIEGTYIFEAFAESPFQYSNAR